MDLRERKWYETGENFTRWSLAIEFPTEYYKGNKIQARNTHAQEAKWLESFFFFCGKAKLK
jgi:hypothetical protein